MIELSARTRGCYVYVKEWTALRDCVAGCLGSLMSLSHQNARLKLRLPDDVKARFDKVQGALKVIKRAGGREVDVELGDLRFGDRRGKYSGSAETCHCLIAKFWTRYSYSAIYRNGVHAYRRLACVV